MIFHVLIMFSLATSSGSSRAAIRPRARGRMQHYALHRYRIASSSLMSISAAWRRRGSDRMTRSIPDIPVKPYSSAEHDSFARQVSFSFASSTWSKVRQADRFLSKSRPHRASTPRGSLMSLIEPLRAPKCRVPGVTSASSRNARALPAPVRLFG